MKKLEKTNPHEYRKILKEREEAQKRKEEQREKAERIAAKTQYEKSIMQNMQNRTRTDTGKPKRPQSGAVAGRQRTSSAVPEIQVKNVVYDEYQKYKDLFLMDVAYTINKDLEEINTGQVSEELDYIKRRTQAEEKQRLKYESEVVDRMLEVYFFGVFPPKEAKKPGEENVDKAPSP